MEVFDRLLSGASIGQVAEEFDMTTQAVHKIKQRIRDRLRSAVTSQIEDEEASDEWGP